MVNNTVTRFNTELEECPVGALVYYVDYVALLEENNKLKSELEKSQKYIEEWEDEFIYNYYEKLSRSEACE